VFASRTDPRFSYCLYVPPMQGPAHAAPDLVVVVHGTCRSFMEYRDAFAEFGRWNHCIILSPLFPIDIRGDGNRDGFKHLREGDIRYDQVLLAMIGEVGARYGYRFDRFALFGYSGGGQFANRFLFLHPQRLWAASVGAPGSVTLLDEERDWWVGVRNVETLFGTQVDLEALKRVPVQLVVGAADLETWEITHQPGSQHWMEGANDAGRTRPERLRTLARSLQQAGIDVRVDIVENMSHDAMRSVPSVTGFFASIRARRLMAQAADVRI
jgi:hypothetical protein